MYPHSWGMVSVADDLCRHEKCELINDEFDMEKPEPYDPHWPWDLAIWESAWGKSQRCVGPLVAHAGRTPQLPFAVPGPCLPGEDGGRAIGYDPPSHPNNEMRTDGCRS